MSKGVNKAIILGNLSRDPETRYMQTGTAVTNFSIATSESWKDKNSGEKQERTEWHNICVFGKLAEICGEYLSKGSKVYIEGSLRTSSWEADGVKKYKTEIVAQNMQMLDSKGSQQPAQSRPQQSGGPIQQDDDFDPDIPFDLHERNWIA